MNDLPWAEALLERFVLPLLLGQQVHVGVPLGAPGAERLQSAITKRLDETRAGETLSRARAEKLEALGCGEPPPRLSDDGDSALLLIALHDLLFLLHPDASRLKPERLLDVARGAKSLCEQAAPEVSGKPWQLHLLYGRHTLFASLFTLYRDDVQQDTRQGVQVYKGQRPPRRFLFTEEPSSVVQRVAVLPELCELLDGLGLLALRALLIASPLTDLLTPARGEGLAALPANLFIHARWLRLPAVARLLLRHYLELGLPTVGPMLSSSLIGALQRRKDRASPHTRRGIGAWLCLLSHLHLLAHVATAAPLPPSSSPPALLDFYALYAALLLRRPALAMPPDVLSDEILRPQIEQHMQRCRALAGPTRTGALCDLLGEPHADDL